MSMEAETLDQRIKDHRLAIARRLRDHLSAGSSDLAATPLNIDPAIYFDPDRHAIERQKIFRETPLAVCLSSDIANPGDYRTFDDSGIPIIVARGRDGQVRAFLNVCPHRGARLVREPAGKAKLFTCWFHGWSFSNQGDFVAAPEAERFGDALEQCQHLTGLPAGERHGVVFVISTPGATLDLDAHLLSFEESLSFLELEKVAPLKSVLMEVKSNWKYVLDTFYEAYHIASMHKKTLAPNYRNDIHLYDSFGAHQRFVLVDRSMENWLLGEDENQWPLDHKLAGSHYIFPNTYIAAAPRPAMANGQGGFYYTVFHIYPGDDVGQTRVFLTLYGPPEVEDEDYRAEIDANCAAIVYLLTSEDFTMAEEAWLGLKAIPKGKHLILGRQEKLVQNIELGIAEAIGVPLN